MASSQSSLSLFLTPIFFSSSIFTFYSCSFNFCLQSYVCLSGCRFRLLLRPLSLGQNISGNRSGRGHRSGMNWDDARMEKVCSRYVELYSGTWRSWYPTALRGFLTMLVGSTLRLREKKERRARGPKLADHEAKQRSNQHGDRQGRTDYLNAWM